MKAMDRYYIPGTGRAMLINTDGTVTPLGELQDMTVEISATMENVYGGDSMFPVFSFIKEKSAQFTFTHASFGLDFLKIAQGATINTGAELFKDETVTVANGSANLSVTSGVITSSVIVVDLGTGTPLKRVTGTPMGNEFSVTTGGVLTFNSASNGKSYLVSYSYTSANAYSADILTTSVPGFVELYHTSGILEQPNGKKIRVYTHIYKARCDGKLNIDFKRGTAYAPKLTFQSLDPQRGDNKFVSVSIEELD